MTTKDQKSDKRMFFISSVLNEKITGNPALANSWYINNDARNMETSVALEKFKEWINND